jgi:hypothetical protein
MVVRTFCLRFVSDWDDVNGGVNELVPTTRGRRLLETFSFIATLARLKPGCEIAVRRHPTNRHMR